MIIRTTEMNIPACVYKPVHVCTDFYTGVCLYIYSLTHSRPFKTVFKPNTPDLAPACWQLLGRPTASSNVGTGDNGG